jgi:hypothetical protein
MDGANPSRERRVALVARTDSSGGPGGPLPDPLMSPLVNMRTAEFEG